MLGFALHGVAVAGEVGVIGRGRSTGSGQRGLYCLSVGAHATQDEPNQNAARGEREIRDEPERRVRVSEEDRLAVLLHEGTDDIRIRLTLLLLFENLGTRRLAEMAL